MKPLYTLRNIRRDFDGRTVLNIESLDLDDGRIYTLTGANGAGKSTLLLMLAFLLQPSAGEIVFRGKSVDWSHGFLHHLRRDVTLVHQAPYLFGTSVFENIARGMRFRGAGREHIRRMVKQALDVVGLADFEKRNAKKLSGGETQRVALARALVLKPTVLLLDEPFANVDVATVAVLDEVIRALPAQGSTVILTTHDPGHAQRLDSTIIHLRAGRPNEPGIP